VTLPHDTAYAGINRVAKFHNIKQHQAKSALSEINSYTLHREYKRPKKRNPYFIYYKRQMIQLDLIDFLALARFNSFTKYLIVAIDCFTRKIWVQPLKSRSAQHVLASLQVMIGEMGDKPESIFADRGSEIKNELVRNYLEQNNIKLWHPFSEVKAGICERVNKTLQQLIYRYMTENETRTYITSLPMIVETYNSRPHSSIGKISPNNAELPENFTTVVSALRRHYASFIPAKKVYTFKVGDKVRIKTNYGRVFSRSYEEQFSREIFEIIRVNTRLPIPMFMLRSTDTGEDILGGVYAAELTKTTSDVFKIEKVLKRRVRDGKPEIFVKWINFGSQHNSWIPETDVTNVY
jgi:hypothetical protein